MIDLIQMGTSYRVQHMRWERRTKRCGRCHLSTPVDVLAIGSGVVGPSYVGKLGTVGDTTWYVTRGLQPDANSRAEGDREAKHRAGLNAGVTLFLGRCLSCGKRPLLAYLVAPLLGLPYGAVAAVVGGVFAMPFVRVLDHAFIAALATATFVVGWAAGLRLGTADAHTRRAVDA
ncbi:MAG: hypothetical protein MUC96_29385 [Myxococcaceae bacterium]|jgi:hypothetical protein|nr:hypothetical protein [Myxococcaceae bacterium]